MPEDQKTDPLLDSLAILEANNMRVRNALVYSRRAFTRFFGHLFSKKEVPADLPVLANVFNAAEDPVLEYHRVSRKTGAKVAMAMAMAHGEVINWEKVSSSLPVDEAGKEVALRPFFKKAKKFSKLLVALTEAASTEVKGSSAEAPSSSVTPSAEVP
jgi:hypothetical protein